MKKLFLIGAMLLSISAMAQSNQYCQAIVLSPSTVKIKNLQAVASAFKVQTVNSTWSVNTIVLAPGATTTVETPACQPLQIYPIAPWVKETDGLEVRTCEVLGNRVFEKVTANKGQFLVKLANESGVAKIVVFSHGVPLMEFRPDGRLGYLFSF